jgi:hypothetical protein
MARPRTGKALTASERMRRYRVRQRAAALEAIKAKTELMRTLAKAYGATSVFEAERDAVRIV